MTDYGAASAEATDYLVEADLHLARTGRLPSIPLPADTLRALLAGPPEPSVEEVARAWLDRSMPLPPPDSRLNVAMRALAISAAERVQALYRSKTND